MEQKENVKGLFFNWSTKQWHFEELVKKSGMSRAQTNQWLQKLTNEGIIKKIMAKGNRAYYISNYKHSKFKTEKIIFALTQFEKIGFLAHLASLKKAKTVIIFGSFARSDWHNESDIDLFIYGNADEFEKGYYEKKLKREIHIFNYKNKSLLKNLEPTVFSNILSGVHIKGKVEPFTITLHPS